MPSSLIVLICTQKCSWPGSWLSSRKLCGKYVEVRRPVRFDYDRPMWSVMYKQIIDIVSGRHKIGCHARRRRSRKLICWMCIFHWNKKDSTEPKLLQEISLFKTFWANLSACVSSSILPHTAGVKMRRDNVRLRYKIHVNMCTVASGWQIL